MPQIFHGNNTAPLIPSAGVKPMHFSSFNPGDKLGHMIKKAGIAAGNRHTDYWNKVDEEMAKSRQKRADERASSGRAAEDLRDRMNPNAPARKPSTPAKPVGANWPSGSPAHKRDRITTPAGSGNYPTVNRRRAQLPGGPVPHRAPGSTAHPEGLDRPQDTPYLNASRKASAELKAQRQAPGQPVTATEALKKVRKNRTLKPKGSTRVNFIDPLATKPL